MAKKKIKTFTKMPNGGYIVREKSYGTKYLQNKETGRLRGRKSVRGKGDGTRPLRVKKPFVRKIKVKGSNGKRGYVRKKHDAGEILGRISG